MSKFCSKCGAKQNDLNSNFCSSCGEPLDKIESNDNEHIALGNIKCPFCSKQIPIGIPSCPFCGNQFYSQHNDEKAIVGGVVGVIVLSMLIIFSVFIGFMIMVM